MAPHSVYVVDFSVYKPPSELLVDRHQAEVHAKHWPAYSEAMRDFMVKVRPGLALQG